VSELLVCAPYSWDLRFWFWS